MRTVPTARLTGLVASALTFLACGGDDPPSSNGNAASGGSTSTSTSSASVTTSTGMASDTSTSMGGGASTTTTDASTTTTATTAGGASSTMGTTSADGGASSTTTVASTTSGSGGMAVSSDDYVGSIEVTVHDDVNTILVVTWEQLTAADSTWLEFSIEGEDPMTSRPKTGELGEHTDVVLGVPGETDVTISVVSQVGTTNYTSTPVVGTTDAVPSSMPKPTVMDYDPERSTPERWLLGAVEDSSGNLPSNYLNGQAWLYVIDRQGRIVWYYNDPSRTSPMGFPRMARDGEYLVAEESRVGNNGRVIKMTLDRDYYEVIDIAGLADAIDVTDSGSLLYDKGNSRGDLYEMTADGNERFIWSCIDELALQPNCYSNTINWNPVEDSVFMSFPEPGVVVEIDRASGDIIGYYGTNAGGWEFAPPLSNPPDSWNFGFQHFANLSPTGTLMVSSHMPGYEDFNTTPTPNQHAFLEFAIDRDQQILTEVWRYTEGPEWPHSRGMALRLENGNTLGNYGTAGVIREITPDKDTVFYVKFDIDGGDDNYNKLVGNNFFVDDLYALNGGPQ